MNKTAIKNFAIWARNKLIADISYRAGLMGITPDGIHPALPQSTGQTKFYDIGTAESYAISGEAIRQRGHLVELIRRKAKDSDYKTAYKYIIEEVAYTWFNRLIAVRFMEVNDYLPGHIRVLSSDQGKIEPDLVTTPFDADLDFSRDEKQAIIDLKNENKLDEVFRLLFIKQCNALNEILPELFEKTNDYTELLLNLSVVDQDGVVYHLVHNIPEEDFDVERGGQVEIIGWLYQYYNEEGFNSIYDGDMAKKDVSKELLPFATQLFTPDWVVRYMIENSLGRIWIEGHPNDDLKASWEYYLEKAEQEQKVQENPTEIREEYMRLNPEDIKVIDPCMGSGHILVYAFEVLMQIYESVGYSQKDAARFILNNNLYGLDIDNRAFQMAYFAVLMKARQYNRRIFRSGCKPNIYSIQESNEINRNQFKFFGVGMSEPNKDKANFQLNKLLDTFKDAKEYGSILRVDNYDWNLLYRFVSNVENDSQLSFEALEIDKTIEQVKKLIAQGHVLGQKYEVVVTNPPYLGDTRFSPKLKRYIKEYYKDEKGDLSIVMLYRMLHGFLKRNGLMSSITTKSWMFISSFQKFRYNFLEEYELISLVDFGTELFDGKIGHLPVVSWVNRNSNTLGQFTGIKLSDFSYSLRQDKQKEFHNIQNRFYIDQKKLRFVPGQPVAYWISDRFLNSFKKDNIGDYVISKAGVVTGNDPYFIRMWQEINKKDIEFHREIKSGVWPKYAPMLKGGPYRRHYGNQSYVLKLADLFIQEKVNVSVRRGDPDYYFKQGIGWSYVGNVSRKGFRLVDNAVCGTATPTIYLKNKDNIYYVLALLNSSFAEKTLDIISPTINLLTSDICKIPMLINETYKNEVTSLEKKNVEISKQDWDSFETSWDFQRHPLLNGCTKLVDAYYKWESECENRFTQLKANEERLNRIFIDIYDLQTELNPKEEDKDVTVRHADLQRDIKSLLSYAVGCMFGRYSHKEEGIVYAGGEWDNNKYHPFFPYKDNIIPITDEEYLEDDIVSRLCEWLKVVYGKETLEENLDFIAKALRNKGSSSREIIRNYFLTDFFKDHCQTYSVTGSGKRPIYWLFDSGKQNGFKALIYLHRYNADIVGNLRIDYLHRMQRIYESEIARMQDMIDNSTNSREVAQATKRKEKLTKQLKECREHDEKLAHLALSRIELNLDDGVKVNYRKLQTANDGKFYEVLADSNSIMTKK